MVEDDDGALIDRQLAETTLELIAIVDQAETATVRPSTAKNRTSGPRRVRFASA